MATTKAELEKLRTEFERIIKGAYTQVPAGNNPLEMIKILEYGRAADEAIQAVLDAGMRFVPSEDEFLEALPFIKISDVWAVRQYLL